MEEKRDNKDQLLANEHLANERTFLSWIRTGIGIMAFGFVAVKFSLFMNQISPSLFREDAQLSSGFSDYAGIGLVAAGALTTLLSYIRYRQTIRLLRKGEYQYSTVYLTIMTAVIFALSILLIAYLIQSSFPTNATAVPVKGAMGTIPPL